LSPPSVVEAATRPDVDTPREGQVKQAWARVTGRPKAAAATAAAGVDAVALLLLLPIAARRPARAAARHRRAARPGGGGAGICEKWMLEGASSFLCSCVSFFFAPG
jgi:hypothetical protein